MSPTSPVIRKVQINQCQPFGRGMVPQDSTKFDKIQKLSHCNSEIDDSKCWQGYRKTGILYRIFCS